MIMNNNLLNELDDEMLDNITGGAGETAGADKCPGGKKHNWERVHTSNLNSKTLLIEYRCTKCGSAKYKKQKV